MELIILSENLYEWRARQQTQIHIRDGISVLKTYFLESWLTYINQQKRNLRNQETADTSQLQHYQNK